MRALAHIRPRWWLLVGAWLTLGAWGPVEEGTEVSLEAGGGEYEWGACGTLSRYRYGGTRLKVQHRLEDSPFYLGADVGGYTETRIIERVEETEKLPSGGERLLSRRYDFTPAVGKEYLMFGPRLGMQYSLLGVETGVEAYLNRYDTGAGPFGALRLRPRPRHSLEIALMEQSPVRPLAVLGRVGYVYAGSDVRFVTGVEAGFYMSSLQATVEKRISEHNWIGLGLNWAGKGEFAPMGGALVHLRWSDAKAMPANWSEVEKPDFLLKPFLR